MDYSLMVAVDEVIVPPKTSSDLADTAKARKELVVGIIDVVRTYTWVSEVCYAFLALAHRYRIKNSSRGSKVRVTQPILSAISLTFLDRGFAGGGRNRPTVTSPKVRAPF
jgi:1-phosphatidylinositol-3-phosphate 5-kinase